MGKGFYLKLAFNNLIRNQKKLIPYFIAAVLMISIYFMVNMILYSPGLSNIPEHKDLQLLFQFGLYILAIFVAVFMLYINSFLIKQRKKELGLYGILGLEKRHIGRVLLWENIMLQGSAVLTGIITGCVFGWLIFMLLMKSVNVSLNSYFTIPAEAFFYTAIYFIILYFMIAVLNLLQIRMSNPIDLLKSEHQGEKKSRFLVPITILGLFALGVAYYTAIKVTNPLMALNQFFIAVILVIAATYALFTSGSIFFLRRLKRNKNYYYKPANFVSVAGMLHRMKQNAAGLASICILSTMVLVTVSTCIALYMGQEDILTSRYKDDITLEIPVNTDKAQLASLGEQLHTAAQDNNVEIEDMYQYVSGDFSLAYQDGGFKQMNLSSNEYATLQPVEASIIFLSDFNRICGTQEKLTKDKIIMLSDSEYEDVKEITLPGTGSEINFKVTKHMSDSVFTKGKNRDAIDEVYFVVKDKDAVDKIMQKNYHERNKIVLNIRGSKENGYLFSKQAGKAIQDSVIDSIYLRRAAGYSLYGGLLFMGAFFTILFLCATVLIIYFKQISEGYEDKDRFEMLQKVGMDDIEVKRTINKQILIVFFLPLLSALLHLFAASHMIIKLLGLFMLYNERLTYLCMIGSCMVFTFVYIIVYRMTARTYCRIVSW